VTVRASNFRREESGKLNMMSEADQANKILADLRRYIDVLRQSQSRNWAEASAILWGRYAQHRTWPDIMQELYGNMPDFIEKKDAYRRRLFRRRDSALEDIWTHFDTKSQKKYKGEKTDETEKSLQKRLGHHRA
jgi:hypothetical protein